MRSPKRFFASPSPEPQSETGDHARLGLPKSRFTFRHLSQLAASSVTCPLRVIAHIDLDAFYAQCETVRLGIPEDKPLAVQQWQGLIAVNYPARKFGINRHCPIDEARKLCPELICQHVATWREGDDKWAYRDDAAANIGTDKVSLDPYRLQSRRILALIKECLPPTQCKVEKASVDEVFIDLSANVHTVLLERFPELAATAPRQDPFENLPPPSSTVLDWQSDNLVDLDEVEAETDDPDWDDVVLLLASEIVRNIRLAVRERLGYTCSAGVASNKLLSKLGSAHRKPNQQTVIRNRSVHHFLSDLKFTKIRNLGGKLGEQVVEAFGSDSVSELLAAPLELLKAKLGAESGTWVYHIIRGDDAGEPVNSRTQIKSMLSAKSFRPSINRPEQAASWLRIFAADIFARLIEEGVLENKRRPRTMNLHHRNVGQTRSRSCQIPQGKALDEQVLYELAQTLLRQIVAEAGSERAWSCDNLSLQVAGFEDGITGNMGIGGFLVKGEEAQALRSTAREGNAIASAPARARADAAAGQALPGAKRRRVNDGGIQRFFAKGSAPNTGANLRNDEGGSAQTACSQHRQPSSLSSGTAADRDSAVGAEPIEEVGRNQRVHGEDAPDTYPTVPQEAGRQTCPPEGAACRTSSNRKSPDQVVTAIREDARQWPHDNDLRIPAMNDADGDQSNCPRCGLSFDDGRTGGLLLQDHLDHHLAEDLQEEEEQRGVSVFARRQQAVVPRTPGSSGRGAGRAGASRGGSRGRRGGHASASSGSSSSRRPKAAALDPGQSRLNFG
ncbi:hypothetical protein RB601_004135 [Gaeumannomyces tritici]